MVEVNKKVKLFEDDEVYTTINIANRLKITKEALYGWIKSGRIKSMRVGNKYRILGKDINAFLKSN